MVANGTRQGDGKRARGRALKVQTRGFAGGPVAKTSASHAGGASSIPGRELRFHMPHSQNIKTKSRGNILTVSKKTLKEWST